MSARQLALIAIPVAAAAFLLFLALIASSRKAGSKGSGSQDLKQKFAEALDAVPGGIPDGGLAQPQAPAAGKSEGAATGAATAETSTAKTAASIGAAVATAEAPAPAPPSGDGHRLRPAVPRIELEPVEPASDPESEGMTRRQVLNRGILLTLGAAITSFGGAILAFLWPKLSGGFGSVIAAGNIDEIKAAIAANDEPFYNASGRFYLMTYETALPDEVGESLYPKAFSAYKELGLIALYQKCPHLGCKVPWCKSSQWFECPCHGSKYNAAGEWQGGPAPRGMWHFPIKLQGSTVLVDTGTQIVGPPKGTNTPVDPSPKGPHCVGI